MSPEMGEPIDLPSCDDPSIFLACVRVDIDIDVLRDESSLKVMMPDGVILTRCEDSDSGKQAIFLQILLTFMD
jgi:hypothetical protein